MLNIIHETKDIIIVNKPAGQLSQGAKGFDLDLVSEVMTYNASQGKSAYAAIINRLDRPVSGLVLIARNKSAAAKYSTLMQKEGGFNKQYEALICGKLYSYLVMSAGNQMYSYMCNVFNFIIRYHFIFKL